MLMFGKIIKKEAEQFKEVKGHMANPRGLIRQLMACDPALFNRKCTSYVSDVVRDIDPGDAKKVCCALEVILHWVKAAIVYSTTYSKKILPSLCAIKTIASEEKHGLTSGNLLLDFGESVDVNE